MQGADVIIKGDNFPFKEVQFSNVTSPSKLTLDVNTKLDGIKVNSDFTTNNATKAPTVVLSKDSTIDNGYNIGSDLNHLVNIQLNRNAILTAKEGAKLYSSVTTTTDLQGTVNLEVSDAYGLGANGARLKEVNIQNNITNHGDLHVDNIDLGSNTLTLNGSNSPKWGGGSTINTVLNIRKLRSY
ncbi:MAG: hypothetical protein RCG15_05550 [Candidatus Rickettsia vulgarisii]